jgi:hypothetical protein
MCGTSIVNGRTAVALVVQSDVVTDMVASGWLRVEAPKNSSTAASSNGGVCHVEWPDRPPVSQRGNRRLNHALDLAAICHIRTEAIFTSSSTTNSRTSRHPTVAKMRVR